LNDAVRHAVELEAFYRAENEQQGMIRSIQTDNLYKEFEELKTVVSSLKQSVDRMQRQGIYERQDNKYVKTPISYDQRRVQHFPQKNFQHRYYNKNRLRTPYINTSVYKRSDSGYKRGNRTGRNCNEVHGQNLQNRSTHATDKTTRSENDKQNINSSGHLMAGLYASANFGNVSVNCLVDTGATVTVKTKLHLLNFLYHQQVVIY
jgi:hypothetical protein